MITLALQLRNSKIYAIDSGYPKACANCQRRPCCRWALVIPHTYDEWSQCFVEWYLMLENWPKFAPWGSQSEVEPKEKS